MLVTIVSFVIVFGILVFIHELGHYLMAKRAKILVREFSIGMGPKIFSYRGKETTYTIRILPIGGYVRMAGSENDDDELKKGMVATLFFDKNNVVNKINLSKKVTLLSGLPIEVTDWDLIDDLWIEGYENGDESKLKKYKVDHDARIIQPDGTDLQIAPKDTRFQSASLMSRILTNIAGPVGNIILAIVAFTIVAILRGGVVNLTNTIDKVQPNSVAQKAHIKTGDKIIAVNGEKVTNWMELTEKISNKAGKKIDLVVQHKKELEKMSVVPESKIENGKKKGVLGITSKVKYDKSIFAIALDGFKQTWLMSTLILSALSNMFTHGFNLNDFGGPVAMYSYTSQAAQYGVISVISLLGMISINLAIINLLPIPALDGGKLVLNFIEAIRGKPLSEEKETWVTVIGFGFLMFLMVLVTWNDIQRYFFN